MKLTIILLITCTFSVNALSQTKDINERMEQIKNEKYCLQLKDGIMVLMKDGILSTAGITLRDGSKVSMDGNILRSDGINITMKDGECINIDGVIENVIVENQKQKKNFTDLKEKDKPLEN